MRLEHYSTEKELEIRFQQLYEEAQARRLRSIVKGKPLARKTIAFSEWMRSFMPRLLSWSGIIPLWRPYQTAALTKGSRGKDRGMRANAVD
jgi:hypothetical protein